MSSGRTGNARRVSTLASRCIARGRRFGAFATVLAAIGLVARNQATAAAMRATFVGSGVHMQTPRQGRRGAASAAFAVTALSQEVAVRGHRRLLLILALSLLRQLFATPSVERRGVDVSFLRAPAREWGRCPGLRSFQPRRKDINARSMTRSRGRTCAWF